MAISVLENGRLTEEDTYVVEEYRRSSVIGEEEMETGEQLRASVMKLREVLGNCDPLGRGLDREGIRSPRSRRGKALGGQQQEVKECAVCRSCQEPHLLAHCSSCSLEYHIHCLSPPLARLPKNTKQWLWQCAECDKKELGSFDIPVQVWLVTLKQVQG